MVCKGCNGSWVFQDRIDRGKVHQCLDCGKPWQHSVEGQRYKWWSSETKNKVQPPPGLGKSKKGGGQAKHLEVIQKSWGALPEACKDAFKSVGIDYEEKEPEPDIYKMLKPHLQALPEEVKKVVEQAAPQPEETTEATLTRQLKQAVGQIRDLSTKKMGLQTKADQAKAIYKNMLEELKQVTDQIEKIQKDLENLSKTYSTMLAEQRSTDVPGTPKAAPAFVIDGDMADQDMVDVCHLALVSAGFKLTEEQKAQLETACLDQLKKKRKIGSPARHCG